MQSESPADLPLGRCRRKESNLRILQACVYKTSDYGENIVRGDNGEKEFI